MNRRNFVKWLSAVTVVFSLGACSGTSVVTIAAQAAQDISLIGAGLVGALPGLAQSGVVSSSVLAQVSSWITEIQTVASSITTASTQVAGQTAVQEIETLVNNVVGALAGLNLPTPFGPALSAATVLLPVIEVAVGLVVTTVSGAAPATAAVMTPDQARLILAGAAKH